MPIVKPFSALRPDPALASRICELPYDVMSTSEARAVAAGNPLSFFHVSKPEIDLAPGIASADGTVYAQGLKSFTQLIASGALKRDPTPKFYLYRQIMGQHSQLGLVAVASCEDYLQNTIRKHELTRPEKEDDRVRHIEHLGAQTGPAFLIYPDDPALSECLKGQVDGPPDVDFRAADGVRHTSWTIIGEASEELIASRFAATPLLYIADGHHRTAAAARVYQKRGGAELNGYFLSVLFPHSAVRIQPYHRVLRDLHGLAPGELMRKLEEIFVVSGTGATQPEMPHAFGFYLGGTWHALTFRPQFTAVKDPLEQLDVALLQKLVLAPLFGIDDPRTSERLHFVGGIRGTSELERLVDGGEYACAFSMFPTSVEELIAVANAGGLMPPKSTWFEPKLRDGMFCHLLD